MKLSEGVEWGLHCVVTLAALPPGATLPARALAESFSLSETYLSKHLQALANARIIESLSGPRGGYRLLRSPEKITALEVVEAAPARVLWRLGREVGWRARDRGWRGSSVRLPTAKAPPSRRGRSSRRRSRR